MLFYANTVSFIGEKLSNNKIITEIAYMLRPYGELWLYGLIYYKKNCHMKNFHVERYKDDNTMTCGVILKEKKKKKKQCRGYLTQPDARPKEVYSSFANDFFLIHEWMAHSCQILVTVMQG